MIDSLKTFHFRICWSTEKDADVQVSGEFIINFLNLITQRCVLVIKARKSDSICYSHSFLNRCYHSSKHGKGKRTFIVQFLLPNMSNCIYFNQ